MHTHWTSDAEAALKSPVTEVAFFALNESPSNQAKALIEEALAPILQIVKRVCNAQGSIGWGKSIISSMVAKSNSEQRQRLCQVPRWCKILA